MIREDVKIGKTTKVHQPSLVNLYGCIIGEDCVVAAFVEIGQGVIIGNNCKIQAFCFIPEGVVIGNNVFIGPNVTFTNAKYPPQDKEVWSKNKTIVEDNVSIGAGSIILPNITIAKNTRIGAGTVVTKDTKENDILIGVPARTINRFRV
jgi:UDP-2-acetamido-3-amino-2,3-dideoxy-glucuronate N-acetyltransferase